MIRLALRVRREQAEVALAELLALAPAGVEETELDGGLVEYAIYGPPGELPELPALQVAAGDALVDVETTEVPGDWAERWRRFHRPVLIADRLHVRPPWVEDVVIDPGQAFGTGAHDTTRLCLELLLTLEPRGPLADVGCGSGVLGIAAAKLGWGPVLALDHEAAAVEATRANAAANGVQVEARRWDLRSDPLPDAPIVLANLVRPLLLRYAERIERPPARLLASGLLPEEAEEVAAAFARHGLRERARRASAEWAALLLEIG